MGWQFDIQGKKKKQCWNLLGFHKATAKMCRIELATPLVISKCSFFLSELDPLNTHSSFSIYHPCFSLQDCWKLLVYKLEHQLQEMQVSDMLWYIVWWGVLSDCDSHTPCCSSGKMLPALTWTGSTGCTMPAVYSWAGFSLHLWNRWWAGSGEEKRTLSTKNKLLSYVICLDEQWEEGFVLPLSMQKCSPEKAAAPQTILGSLIDWYLTVFEVWVYQSPRRLNSGAQQPRE